jgi:Flp pilus assembly protein protease CpaA
MIEKYYFLFALAAVFSVFASIQDLRRREVADWLNFSLVAFALAYRAFYSAVSSEWSFFVYGAVGALIFFGIANLFYYSKMMGGGDAKLLMGFGAILPFEGLWDYLYLGAGFILLLLVAGAVYSLIWSVFIAIGSKKKFGIEFKIALRKSMKYRNIYFLIALAILFMTLIAGSWFGILAVLSLIAVFFLFSYLFAVDKCMIKLVGAEQLAEGDWLENEVKIGRYLVKKSVHGLSAEDIRMLRKSGKKAMIKEGIPFVPVFLAALIIMALFFLVL